MTEQMTDNAKAILLMCGRFSPADEGGTPPLATREYDEVATWLVRNKMQPADLLREGGAHLLSDPFAPASAGRLQALLERGAVMALAIERWTNKGLWVVCRSDRAYPQRLKTHLKGGAPPILYGVGNPELLSLGGLAVVGSRHIDADAEHFAREVGRAAAECGMQVVSGAARGVDETAMHGSFSAGGTVVGVMADSLLSAAVSRKYREGLRGGQLTLISTYNPEAGFNVGNAMGRNKYIYALADFAVVVSSDYQAGGTWAGAQEEMKRERGRPIFVRTGAGVPTGNTELLKLKAMPFPPDALTGGLREALQTALGCQAQTAAADEQPPLPASEAIGDPEAPSETPPAPKASESAMALNEEPRTTTVCDAVRPLILRALDKPRKLEELAKMLQVRKPQLEDWVEALIKDGAIEERVIKRSKKLARREADGELKLS